MLPNELRNIQISLEEIKSATGNFAEKIGGGGFGNVYKGKLSRSNRSISVAVKVLEPDQGQGLHEFLTEIDLLARYNQHDNLVKFTGFCDEVDESDGKRTIALVYEYALNGSLDKYLRHDKEKACLTWKQRLKICIGAARGLNHLHTANKNQTLVHRDVKSSNILLDQDFVAKISDFGLSKLFANSRIVDFAVTRASGTPGYCDPVYLQRNILTEKSDVYSFGVVLFEVLCARPAVVVEYKEGDVRRFLGELATAFFDQKRLDEIIDPDIREQIDASSLICFSEIARQCLEEKNYRDRPSMAKVVEKLENALKLQLTHEEKEAQIKSKGENDSTITDGNADTYWDEKLPSGYEEILRRADSRVDYATKEELFSILSEGILVDKGTTLFWLSKDDGKICQKISATEIFNIDSNPRKCNFISLSDARYGDPRETRFVKVAKFMDATRMNVQVKIRTEMLSLETLYAAYLVFYVYTYSTSKTYDYGDIIYDFDEYGAKFSSRRYIQPQGMGKWMEIELWHFFNDDKNAVFEFELKKIGQFNTSIIVEAIEFRPFTYTYGVTTQGVESPPETKDIEGMILSNNVDENVAAGSDLLSNSNTEWDKKVPSDYREIIDRSGRSVDYISKKEIYLLLSKGLLIDNDRKWFSLSKLNGKKCYMISARELSFEDQGDILEEIEWESSPGSRFPEVAKIVRAEKLEVRGKLKTRVLSPGTSYAAFLVFKHQPKPDILHEKPIEASMKLGGREKHRKTVYLKVRSPMVKPKNDHKPVNPLNLPKDWLQQGKDDWAEINLWTCFSPTEDDDEVEVGLRFKCKAEMKGFYIEGIEFRPMGSKS